VALLRGINVGGKNVIRMADLRTCFVADGFEGVRTYIQSGNVIFSAADADVDALTLRIESLLSDTFGYSATVLLRSRAQVQAAVDEAPGGFGAEPDTYRYDLMFLIPPLTPAEALQSIETREGVDAVAAGPEVVYFSRLSERASQSRLPKLVSKPVYQRMTIRNWNTTTKLLGLLEAAG
jgi:uncharacterized protein (DUF1697 family)